MLNYLGEKIARFLGEEADTSVASPINVATSDFLKYSSISEILPYFTYDEEWKLFINKRSYGFCFEIAPMIGFSNKVERQFESFFKNILPVGSNVQFLLFASPKVGHKLDEWERARSGSNEILREVSKRRADYFRQFAYSCSSKVRDFRAFVSISFELGAYLTKSDKRNVKELSDATLGVFKAAELGARAMDPSELMNLISTLVAPKGSLDYKNLKWNEKDSISNQVSYPNTSIQTKKKSLIVNEGEFCIRTYVATGLPQRWYMGAMDALIGDNNGDALQIGCPFLISYGIYIEKSSFLQEKLLAKGARVEAQAATPLSKWITSLKKEAVQWRVFRERIEEKHKIVRDCYQIALFSTLENITKDESKLNSLYTESRFELRSPVFAKMSSFVSMLPMSWGEGMSHDMTLLKQTRITDTSEPAKFLPIMGEWKGTKTPGMLLTSRKGQLFTWNPFDSQSGYNVMVAAQTGNGKSFAVQELVNSILALGGRAFVLDLGASYKNSCLIQGGNHIDFKTDSGICLNPFSTVPTHNEEDTLEGLIMIKSIIASMASPKAGVSDIQYSFIEQAVLNTWARSKRQSSITDVIIELQKIGDARAKDLSIQLRSYGDGGVYGKIFEGEANTRFDNPFNVIEIGELQNKKEELLSVVFQIFLLRILNDVVLSGKDIPTMIVFEEIWKMVQGGQSADFIGGMVRTIRKAHGSMVSVSQSVRDFYKNDVTRTIFENSEWRMLLQQDAESVKGFRKDGKLSMSESEEDDLLSLKTIRGEYSEIMIKNSRGYAIGRLTPDPFTKVLYSSSAERTKVNNLVESGMTLKDAVLKVAHETYGSGV